MVRNKKKRENNEMVASVSENDWDKMLKEQNKKNKLSREFSGYVSEWNYNLHLEEKISSLPFDIVKLNSKTKYFKARLIVEGEIVQEKDVEKFTQNVMEQGDMSKEKKKEFKEGDRVFDTEIGWCEIERVNKSNCYLYNTKRTYFNRDGKTDSGHLRQLFHSPQDASEYFAKIKEPMSKEKEMLVILYDVQANHNGRLSERHTTELEKLIEYFEGAVDKTAQKN